MCAWTAAIVVLILIVLTAVFFGYLLVMTCLSYILDGVSSMMASRAERRKALAEECSNIPEDDLTEAAETQTVQLYVAGAC